jgi:hypothetical protein
MSGRSRRAVLVVCVACALATVLPGAAEAGSTAPGSKKLGAGNATVAACGSLTGVVPDFTLSGSTITAVALTGIPSTCNGGSLRLTLTNGSTSLAAAGPVTVVSGAATVSISPAAATASVTHVRLSITGP